MKWYISIANRLKDKPSTNIRFNDSDSNPNVKIFIEGYIMPRDKYFSKYKHLSQVDLISRLYDQYELDFIHYIKGVFIIILNINDAYYLFNDRHSLKKFFVYEKSSKIIITNELRFISDAVQLEIDRVNAALFCIMEHFVNGNTLFKNVSFSNPASRIKLWQNQISFEQYWQPDELFNIEKQKLGIEYYCDSWQRLMKNYLSYLNPKDVTIMLTGGNDSRMILAGLLGNEVKPYAFSFGNPDSADCIIAKTVAEKAKISYTNYFIQNPTQDWFSMYSNKIVRMGNSLVNMHRAHRLNAIEEEKRRNPNSDLVFGGFMGGEYIKGLAYDDYIIPKLLRLYEEDKKIDTRQLITKIIHEKEIYIDSNETDELLHKLSFILNLKNTFNKKQREFLYAYYIYGCFHHYQDSQLLSTLYSKIVNPFMDIDFLEILAGSEFWFVNKNNTLLNRLYSSTFLVKITNSLAFNLAHVPYAKKGYYNSYEYQYRPLMYLLKRLKYLLGLTKKYPSNFPLKEWIYKYSKSQIPGLDSRLSSLFNMENIEKELERLREETSEKEWHQITNPINLHLIMEEYG